MICIVIEESHTIYTKTAPWHVYCSLPFSYFPLALCTQWGTMTSQCVPTYASRGHKTVYPQFTSTTALHPQRRYTYNCVNAVWHSRNNYYSENNASLIFVHIYIYIYIYIYIVANIVACICTWMCAI